MSPEIIIMIINAVVGLASAALPLIPKGNSGSAATGKIVEAIVALAPLVTDQVGVVYVGIKNIIDAIGSHPATTEEQLKALMEFDKQVDQAWDAIEAQLDPDNPASA